MQSHILNMKERSINYPKIPTLESILKRSYVFYIIAKSNTDVFKLHHIRPKSPTKSI